MVRCEVDTIPTPTTEEDIKDLKTRLSVYLDDDVTNFVVTQCRVSQVMGVHGRRWPNDLKSFAMAIFHTSRKAYSIFQKFFKMPSASTLTKAMAKIDIKPGVPDRFIELFKIQVKNMTLKELLTLLMADEIALKSGLDHDPHSDTVRQNKKR